MNNIKFTNEILDQIYCQLALGNGIKNILKDLNLSWEGFRKLMHKKPKVREQYELAKQDGVDYLLSESATELRKAIEDFKANGKGDLATSHLIKEAVALTKWKASKLLPKYNDNAQKLQLSNADNKPLIVKWSKD
jgi:hypothetical protein|nr:DNA binding protein [uncultured Mediterranean phage uvMED]